MKKETIILSIFIFIAFVITISSIYYSQEFERKNADAGGFGISPPYIKALDLVPGDVYQQSIRVLRSEKDIEQEITVQLVDADIVDWFSIKPNKTVIIKPGEDYVNFNFILKVPDNVYNGKYQGKLYFKISSTQAKKGVSVGLGARADILVTVIGGKDISVDLFENRLQNRLADNELVERLQGRFIMRTESRGQLYYLYPNVKKIFYLSKSKDFLELVKNEARGISNELLSKIEIDLSKMEGVDSDNDGLPDLWEESIGTDIDLADTDDDGFSDLDELKNGFSPLAKDKLMDYNKEIIDSLKGFLLLQVNDRGQIWYLDPSKNKRLLFTNFNNSLSAIEEIALGVSEESYQELLSH